MLAMRLIVFLCIVRLGLSTYEDSVDVNNDLYDDSYSDYEEYQDYEESQDEEEEPFNIPSAETVSDDDNCMGLESYLMKEEHTSCCNLLDSDKVYNITMKTQVENCLALQMQYMYGINDNYDYNDVASRSLGRKCPISGRYKLIKLLCCSYRSCKQYKQKRLKIVCRRCSKICNQVTCPRHLYHE